MVAPEPDEGLVPPAAAKKGLTYFIEIFIAIENYGDSALISFRRRPRFWGFTALPVCPAIRSKNASSPTGRPMLSALRRFGIRHQPRC